MTRHVETGVRPEKTGDRLKRWRKAFGKTQAECAKAFGVDQSKWARWEGGELRPSLDEAYRLSMLTMHSPWPIAVTEWALPPSDEELGRILKVAAR